MANLSNINNKFLVTTGGNVLIGQTSTVGSSLLQVTGNSTFSGNITGTTAVFSGSGTILSLNRNAPGTALIELKIANTIEGYLGATTTKSFVVYNEAGSEKAHVENNGNIGLYGSAINFLIGDFAEINFRESAAITIDSDNNQSSRNFQIKDGSGSSLLTVLDTGNVGIGTTSPGALLNLSQANGANIRFDNETTTNYFTIGEGVGTNNVFSFRGNSYRSTDTLSIDFVNDRVGIGTISPSEKLTLQLDARNQAFSGKNGTDYLWFLRNEAGAGARQSGRFQLMDTDVTTVNIESASNRNTYFNAGNVGIGTTTPGQQLTLSNSSSSKIQIKGHSASNGLFLGMDSAVNAQLWNVENGYIRFATNDTERMAITSGGALRLTNEIATNSKSIDFTNTAGTTGWAIGNGMNCCSTSICYL